MPWRLKRFQPTRQSHCSTFCCYHTPVNTGSAIITDTYDALGRLAQGQTLDLTAANTWKLGWVYDRYGNRSQQNLLGGTISTTAPQLSINATSNRITSSGFQYDAVGNLAADAINTYSYDAENRVTAVNGGSTASYSYDGKGLRVQKVVGSTTTDGWPTQARFWLEWGSCAA